MHDPIAREIAADSPLQSASKQVMRPSPHAAVFLHDPHAAARTAGLRYVSCDDRGTSRRESLGRFSYVSVDGRSIRDAKTLERIAGLAIPPAWKEVWICANADGHIQCTGIDARGRKQYRYHARWRQIRDSAKYQDVLEFGRALPRLRSTVARDLGHGDLRGVLDKGTVVAAVIRVMDRTQIRVGNDRYTRDNHSYGLTTLLARHTKIDGARITFDFRGKGGKDRHASFEDDRLAKIIFRCRELTGQRLFRYCDDSGKLRPVTSRDVNDYIQSATGKPFTAKEFRTWAATVGAAIHLYGADPCRSATHGKRTIRASIEAMARQLGNTQTICRKCYVHPAILSAYLNGALHTQMQKCFAKARQHRRAWFHVDERAVLALLNRAA